MGAPDRLPFLFLLAEIPIDQFRVIESECYGSIYVRQRHEGREALQDRFRRGAIAELQNDGIERDAGARDIVAAVSLLDVFA